MKNGHESLRGCCRAVLMVRAIAYVVLMLGLLAFACSICDKTWDVWAARNSSIAQATAEEQEAISRADKAAEAKKVQIEAERVQQLADIECTEREGLASLDCQEAAARAELEALPEAYAAAVRLLNKKGAFMVEEMRRTEACQVSDFTPLTEVFERSSAHEEVQQARQTVSVNKDSLAAWVVEHILTAISQLQEKLSAARAELERAEAELAQLEDAHRPAVVSHFEETPELVVPSAIAANLYGEEARGQVAQLRHTLVRLAYGSAWPRELELPPGTLLQKNSADMGKWLPLPPAPYVEMRRVEVKTEQPRPWSAEDEARRLALQKKIAEWKSLVAAYEAQLKALQELAAKMNALIRDNWEMDACLGKVAGHISRYDEQQRFLASLDGRRATLREEKEQARLRVNEEAIGKQRAAEEERLHAIHSANVAAVSARNKAREACQQELKPFLSGLLLSGTPAMWVTWAALLVLVDFIVTILLAAPRLQADDKRNNEDER